MLDQPQTLDEPSLLDQRHDGSVSPMAVWWPVVGAAVVIAAFSIAISVAQACQPYPHDQWESIIIADGYRYSVGLPVYTNPDAETGHATHMYGPLMIYAVGSMFKLTGISFLAARLVSLVATIWLIAALTVIYFRRLPRVARIAGVALLISLNGRLHGMFTQIHPDMPAMGFSLLALILMFHAMEKQRWVCLPLALVSFCIAYLFKQTAAMFTIVPLLSLLLRREWSFRTMLAVAAPPAAIIGLIVALAIIAPNVHFHMIVAVSRWPMRFGVLAISPLRLFGFCTLLPVALCVIILVRPLTFSDAKLRWLVAAGMGALPGSLLAYSKAGGWANSLLPALMPLIVLSTLGIAAAWETASASHASPARARAFACLIALLMIVDAIDTSREALHLFVEGDGDQHYPQVVAFVRQLKGRVVCPEDPTIPIVALGQACRSYWAESDAHYLRPLLGLQREVSQADFVVRIDSPLRSGSSPDILREAGFVRDPWDGSDMGVYELWRKRRPGEGDHG